MTSSAGTRRLKVLLDLRPLLDRQTGVANFCRGASTALAAREGLDVGGYAVTWRRQRDIPPLLPAGVAWRSRPMPARPTEAAWRRLGRPPLEWIVGAADVVHGTNFVVPPTRRAARVMTVHDLTPVHYPEMCEPPTLRYPDVVRRAVAEGAWVHTPSQFVADEVVELLGVDRDRVRAVPSGIPPLTSDGQDPGRTVAPDGPFVLAVGTVEPRKDYPTLVGAFDRLAEKRGDLALVIAGADGWGAADLDTAVRDLRHPNQVLRAGYRSDKELAWLVRHAEVLVYPSLYEGFGFPPLQAMKAGVPVVTTDAGAVPEVVGDAALVVPVRDSDALASALESVLDDPDEAARLRCAGREHAARFTWEACAAGLELLYRDACS
ncbi:MAG: glycosyltransferase family 4 protein [Acidimicrobiaceae bacterium]|nr:glycosyltransferase family 4 protein [Acidimicrobiaceae bacterium]